MNDRLHLFQGVIQNLYRAGVRYRRLSSIAKEKVNPIRAFNELDDVGEVDRVPVI